MTKYYAFVALIHDDIESYLKFNTKEEAVAFCKGFNIAKEITKENESDPLSDYVADFTDERQEDLLFAMTIEPKEQKE